VRAAHKDPLEPHRPVAGVRPAPRHPIPEAQRALPEPGSCRAEAVSAALLGELGLRRGRDGQHIRGRVVICLRDVRLLPLSPQIKKERKKEKKNKKN
jgi:hypothetical protein